MGTRQTLREEDPPPLATGFRLHDEGLHHSSPAGVAVVPPQEGEVGRQEEGLGCVGVVLRVGSLHLVQILGEVVLAREDTHAGEVVDLLVGLHLAEDVDGDGRVHPADVPLLGVLLQDDVPVQVPADLLHHFILRVSQVGSDGTCGPLRASLPADVGQLHVALLVVLLLLESHFILLSAPPFTLICNSYNQNRPLQIRRGVVWWSGGRSAFVSFYIMKGEVKSTRFTFVLDSEQTLKNIDHLKMVDYARFKLTNTVGTQILALAKADEWQQIDKLADTHPFLLPFLKLQIEDAFLCALNLRNADTITYFLQNGFKINTVADDAALTLAYSLEYLRPNDAPTDLLRTVLSFGANARTASDRDSETPLHLAAQYGNLGFLELLLQYGADVNAVNDDRETPLGCAIKHKKQAAADFLKQRGGCERWDQS